MGKVLSLAIKPLRNFNLESRAHKIISRNKPLPAPKYESDAIEYERMLKEKPEIIEESLKKHVKLDKHLKDVFVTSHDFKPDVNQNPDRPLPLSRTAVEDFEFGFKEPTKVPFGKVTLRKVLKFISEHQVNPRDITYDKIAEEYLLPEEKVRMILKYFRVYEIYIPEHKNVKATFAGPSVPRTQIQRIKAKQLAAGKVQKEEND